MKKTFVIITSLRFIIHWVYYKNARNRSIIKHDFARNISLFVTGDGVENYSMESVSFYNFCYLLTFYKMTRNIFYARVAKYHRFISKLLSLFASPQPMLDISSSADIGGGLIIQHGYCTIIDPKKMGENCWVNQGVNIGYTNDVDAPTIGDNVRFSVNSCVLGNIVVGDNVIIGANSVVTKNIISNTIVGGVPARFIKENTGVFKLYHYE